MKKLIIFLVIALGLGGYIFLYDNSALDTQKQNAELNLPLYDSFKLQHPHHIIIKKNAEVVDLQKTEQDTWIVANSENYPADTEAIEKMLEAVLSAKQKQVVSNNSQNWDKFEVVEEKGIEVIFKEQSNREIAHFWLGKTGTSYADQYVRKNNLDEVILIDTNLTPNLSKPLKSWRNQTILKLTQDEIESVKMIAKDESESYELSKSGSGWVLNNEEIKQEKVDVVFNALSDLRTIDFPEEKIDLNAENNDYLIEISLGNNKEILYLQETEINGDYLVAKEGTKTLFKISKIKKEELAFKSVLQQ